MTRCRNVIKNIAIFLIIALIIAILFIFHYSPQTWEKFYSSKENVELTALIFVATAAIAIIAYIELTKANEITENEFLLNISNKWGSESIIRSRRELHKLFVSAYRGKKHGKEKKCCRYKHAMNDVAQHVLDMREKKDIAGDNFVDLINLLDFMEIISFFWKRNNIQIEDIDDLFGNSIVFFYRSFYLFIQNRQKYEKQYYINFCNLSKALIRRNKELEFCSHKSEK